MSDVVPVHERKVCNVCGSSWQAPPNDCPGCDEEGGDPSTGEGVPPAIVHDLSAFDAFTGDVLAEFQSAARALKQAESDVAAARQRYAEAVKKLSEEAVR